GYFSDKMGHLAFSYTVRNGIIGLHQFDGENWQRSPVDMETIEILAAADEPGKLLVNDVRYDGQPSAVRLFDPATGEFGAELFRDNGYDVMGGVYRDERTRSIVGLQYDRDMPAAVWWDEGYKALHELFQKSF